MSILEEWEAIEADERAETSTKTPPARTLTRALLILQIVALHENEPLSLARIARKSGLPKPTVHRLAGVLRESGMLHRDEDGCYLPGPMLLVMGTNYLRRVPLRDASRSELMRLHRQTHQAVYLAVPQSTWVVNIARIEPHDQARVTDYVGSLNPQHTTAAGKALLAFGDSESVRNVLRGGLISRTTNSVTSDERLMQELELTFGQGFATEVEENEMGVVSLAAPVFDHSAHVIGAIGLSAPRAQATTLALRHWSEEVMSAASKISTDLGWSGIAYTFLGSYTAVTKGKMRTVS